MKAELEQLRDEVNTALGKQASALPPGRITEGMRLALAAPGKRLRPIAVLLAGETFGGDRARLIPFALAVEMVHTAALLLDDLPSMDDADLRRGAPALHHQIGEADTILVAFALLSRAFRQAAAVPEVGRKERELPRGLVELLDSAIGAEGMCEGQSLDLALADPGQGELKRLEEIHRRKTGALFAAALEGGGRLGGASAEERAALYLYGKNLGLAFQVADDLLDAEGDADRIGKPTGQDAGRRLTFVSLAGIEASREVLRELHGAARDALLPLGRRGRRLRQFADYLENRDA